MRRRDALVVVGLVFTAVFVLPLVFELAERAEGECSCVNGDVNADQAIDIADAIYLLQHLFGNGPPPAAFACCDTLDQRLAALEELTQGLAFGRTVAGTYGVIESFGGAPIAGTLVAITPDGSLNVTSTSDFTPADYYGSPALGSWVQTGERQVTARTVRFRYDGAGVLVDIVRSKTTINFDADFDSFTGSITAETFWAPVGVDDPLKLLRFVDCDEEPDEVAEFTVFGRRLCPPE